jgi:hypothetical protein
LQDHIKRLEQKVQSQEKLFQRETELLKNDHNNLTHELRTLNQDAPKPLGGLYNSQENPNNHRSQFNL